ncbi:hypothetical protein AAFN60_01050 [Roseibacillus persicicus]|uniref:hypothetical protein n=1 Tax=Roseibacillus persicicus TaxID=454148 RepID=UPI00398BB266
MKPTLLFLLPLFALASCEENNRQVDREALQEMEEAQSEFASKLEASLSNEDGPGVTAEDLEAHRDSVNAAADKMGGKLGEAIRAVSALEDDSGEDLAKLDEFVEKFVEAIDWSTLEEADDYDERRALLEEYKEFNEQMIAEQKNRPAEVKKALDQINYEGDERRDFETGVRRKLAKIFTPFATIRQCDIEICDSSVRVLNMLEESKGTWEWDTENDQILFENDDDIELFNAEMALFDEFAMKQAEAQSALVEAIR